MNTPPPPRSRRANAGQTSTVTLQQVAERAGVSPSTVSRILNGTAVVSPAKQAAVQAAIQELGFRPNPVARGLAGGKTFSVGVVTQTISSPFYGEAMYGIEGVLDAAGYASLFVSGNWREDDERKAIETLLSRRVDGLIVFAGRLSDAALKRYAADVPLVLVGRRSPGRQFLSIGFDNRLGAHLAAEHLLSLGHRQIAFITGAHQHADALERRAGFEEALQAAGLKLDPDLVAEGAYTEPSGQQAAQALLARGKPFTALFASNDQMAIGAALALHRAGLRVPQDVSLIGFDDVAVAEFSIPPLTTVRQSVGEIGAQAATAMLDLLADRPPRVTLTPPRLVVRESTAAPRKR